MYLLHVIGFVLLNIVLSDSRPDNQLLRLDKLQLPGLRIVES